ncbi:MAG: MFS transporter, partial [Ilumatobacteraceae bacterium]
MEPQGQRRVPVWTYLVSFVVLGSALSIAGPSLSHLRDRVGTNDGGISLVFVGSSSGYMIGSFLGGRFLDRGLGHQVWTACMTTSIGAIVLISQLRDLAPLVAAFVLLGVACGAGDVSGNTLVVWSRPDSPGAALNALHLFFALGALSAPLLTNRAIAWTDSLWPVAVPLAVLTAICGYRLLTTPAPTKTRAVSHGHAGAGAASVRRGQLTIVAF